jgi:hypothetical protein
MRKTVKVRIPGKEWNMKIGKVRDLIYPSNTILDP